MDDPELTVQPSPLERSIKARWPLLTDDDIDRAGGHIDRLCATIRDRYAISDAEARRQFAQFAEQLAAPVVPGTAPLTHSGAPAGAADASVHTQKARPTDPAKGS